MAPPAQFTSWLGLHCLCPECLQPWIFSSLASVPVSVSLGFSHHTCHQCWQQQRAPDTSPNSEQVQGLLSAPRKNQVLRGKPAFFTVCPQNLCLPPWGDPGPSQVPAMAVPANGLPRLPLRAMVNAHLMLALGTSLPWKCFSGSPR